MNPYDFVPIVEDKRPQGRLPEGHDKFSGKTGSINCTITTLKPFFIPHPRGTDRERRLQGLRQPCRHNNNGDPQYHERYVLHRMNGIPIIPGSSIKGVIRAVAEAAANSCVTFFEKDKPKNYKTYRSQSRESGTVYPKYRLPDGFYPCTDINKLCITCRLFGFQSPDGLFQGKVNISDAKARSGYTVGDCIKLTELSSPKPHHTAFYALLSDQEKIAGRKFYFHHKEDASILTSQQWTHRNSSVKPIDEDAIFDFKVSFANLTVEEYNLLLYSLFLEDDVRHKMGYGKPAGLGSVKLEALKLTLFDTEVRYKRFASDDRTETGGKELRTDIAEQTKGYREDKSANLEALRRIWKWPGEYNIKYPNIEDRDWFLKNPNVPISQTI